MNELQITELNGQRVLTTQQIADGYGTDSTAITKNFNNNKLRFLEGKHFFFLKGADLKEFKSNIQNLDAVGKYANSLYLWTEKGALLHAKSLGTDQAWEMYDILVDTYFQAKETAQLPQTPEQQIMLLAQGNVNLNKEVNAVKERVTELEENTPLSSSEYGYISRRINQRVAEVARGYLHITPEQRSALFKDINQSVNTVAGVPTRTQLRSRHFEMVLTLINNWEPSVATKMQINQLELF